MDTLMRLGNAVQNLLDKTRLLDFLGPLALRLYLVPVFWVAGTNKIKGIEGTIAWFGDTLGMPLPTLMAWMAALTEAGGALLLLIGLAVRWVSVPLMIVMIVAATTVHWDHGWQAVADPKSPFPPEDIELAMERKARAVSILEEHGNIGWLTGSGNFVISNNGIEWAVTYFVMLLSLFFVGAGRFVSVDFWLAKWFRRL